MAAREVPYDVIPTEQDGVELRVLQGAKPTVPPEIVILFYEFARRFAKVKGEVEELNERRTEFRKKLIQYVESIPGLRGIRSSKDDFDVLVVQRDKVEWDRDLLQASLGIAYPTLVSEELVATITIPPGVTTEKELRHGLARFLEDLGVPAVDVEKILATDVQLRIDLEKLGELEADKRVKLFPGTKSVDVEWAIEAEPLRKLQKKKAKKKTRNR